MALLVVLVGPNSTAGGKFLDDFDLPGSDSQAALDLLEDHGFANRAGFSGQVHVEARDDLSPATRDEVRAGV